MRAWACAVSFMGAASLPKVGHDREGREGRGEDPRVEHHGLHCPPEPLFVQHSPLKLHEEATCLQPVPAKQIPKLHA